MGRLRAFGLFAILVIGAIAIFRGVANSSPYELLVPLADANGLYPGSDVLVAGSRAGSVEEISVQGTHALVKIRLDPAESPVHSDATVALRPKSLLGEKYLALNPGNANGVLDSGTTLPAGQVMVATDLQDVVNTFDAPTRAKLQVLIDNLGPAVNGRGQDLSETFTTGRKDLDSLGQVAQTLGQRDRDLQTVIQALNQVLTELAQSDRRTQLGVLINNSNTLLANLSAQDASLKKALTEADAALSRNDKVFSGTAGNLNRIFLTLDPLVSNASVLTGDLAAGMYVTQQNLGVCSEQTALANCQPGLLKGIREGPEVFGGMDQYGYATRISVVAGPGTVGLPTPGAPTSGAATVQGGTDAELQSLVDFLMGGFSNQAAGSTP
jgi:phospholipid/cholesterol/gamma-HCH transport system substrate-binding protein